MKPLVFIMFPERLFSNSWLVPIFHSLFLVVDVLGQSWSTLLHCCHVQQSSFIRAHRQGLLSAGAAELAQQRWAGGQGSPGQGWAGFASCATAGAELCTACLTLHCVTGAQPSPASSQWAQSADPALPSCLDTPQAPQPWHHFSALLRGTFPRAPLTEWAACRSWQPNTHHEALLTSGVPKPNPRALLPSMRSPFWPSILLLPTCTLMVWLSHATRLESLRDL